MSLDEDIEIPPTIQLEGILHRRSKVFVPVFDGEEDEKELFHCFSCADIGIESVLSKEITYATVDKEGNTILKDQVDIPGLDTDKEYRQCHRCGNIYSLSNLKKKRRREELEEQERDERDHNWRPDELTKSTQEKLHKGSESKPGKKKPFRTVSETKRKLGKLRRIQRVKVTKRI